MSAKKASDKPEDVGFILFGFSYHKLNNFFFCLSVCLFLFFPHPPQQDKLDEDRKHWCESALDYTSMLNEVQDLRRLDLGETVRDVKRYLNSIHFFKK